MSSRTTAHDKARTSDPQTSFEAALVATGSEKLRASQARVLNMFKLYGDMHDKQMLQYLQDAERSIGLKPMSPSGARSRRSELAKPNMERLAGIILEMRGLADTKTAASYDLIIAQTDKAMVHEAREQLRREGFRSPLWDTGRREKVDGHTVVIWGLAR